MMKLPISFAVLLLTAPAHAAIVGEDGVTIHGLTTAQIAAISDAQAQRKDGTAPLGVAEEPNILVEDISASKRKVHGEICIGIGTGGYSQIFGTVVAPISENGVFAFSFSQANGGQHYRRRGR